MRFLNFLIFRYLSSLVVFILVFLVFNFAYAQGGLVPCGNPGQPPCDFCHLMTLANKVVDFAFEKIILPLVALGILASGLVLLTAGGSQTQLEKGKSMLWNILIGFFVALSAWVIINTVLGTLVKEGSFFNPLTEKFPACKLI